MNFCYRPSVGAVRQSLDRDDFPSRHFSPKDDITPGECDQNAMYFVGLNRLGDG